MLDSLCAWQVKRGVGLLSFSRGNSPMNRRNAFALFLPLLTVTLCFAQTRSPSPNTYRNRIDRFQLGFPTSGRLAKAAKLPVQL